MTDRKRRDFDDALSYAGDESRRLEGEDPATRQPDDAHHWERVYRELHAFKIDVLKSAQERGRTVEDEGQEEVGNDITILEAEARRLRTRLEYWSQRRRELEEHGRAPSP